MDLKKITENKRVKYAIKTRVGVCEGAGEVTQVYKTKTGHRVVIHDKAKNRDVTARPSQVLSA